MQGTRMKLSPRLALLACAAITLAGCTEPGVPVEIQFQAMVGDQLLDCETSYENQGRADTTLSFTDFRFYVHNIRLVTQEGEEFSVTLDEDGIWQQEHLALLDFENGKGTCRNGSEQMHTTLIGTVADQVYSEIRFTIGVPFEDNHVNTATAQPPLTFTNMSWGWQGGFKFLRADVASEDYNFIFHLGSTGCEGTIGDISGCSQGNRAEVAIQNFDPRNDVIIIDAQTLFQGTDVSTNTEDTLSGCMSITSDADCNSLFENMGLNLETGEPDSVANFFRVGP